MQRVDVPVTSDAGKTVTLDLSLDQTRQLVIDLTNAYGAGRPALLDQKHAISAACISSSFRRA